MKHVNMYRNIEKMFFNEQKVEIVCDENDL